MNCRCNPPRSAVVKLVQKNGENYNKEYYCCASDSCNFFGWVGAPMPASLSTHSILRHERIKAPPQSAAGGETAKISLYKIEHTEVFRIWFTISSTVDARITTFYQSLEAKGVAEYKVNFKMWIFDFRCYDEVVRKLRLPELRLNIIELPKFLSGGLKKYLKICESFPLPDPALNLQPDLESTLLPFQIEGIQFVVEHGGRALIGDEMGCGKTLQAIGVLQHYRYLFPALVVAPVSLMTQWREELLKYSGDILRDADIQLLKKGSDTVVVASKKVVLVPYSIIDKLLDSKVLTPDEFKLVIVDESHNIKSGEAKRTTATSLFLRNATVAVCLSGTPAINRPVELYTQLHALRPTVFSSFEQFAQRYCDAKPNRFNGGMDYKGSSNTAELKMLLEGLVMIRRLKADVVKNLPEKFREVQYIEPDAVKLPQLQLLKKQMKKVDEKLADRGLEVEEQSRLKKEQGTLLMAYYKATGESKIGSIRKEVARLVEDARLERLLQESKFEEARDSMWESKYNDASTTNVEQRSEEVKDAMSEEVVILEVEDSNSTIELVQNSKRPKLMELEDDIMMDTDVHSKNLPLEENDLFALDSLMKPFPDLSGKKRARDEVETSGKVELNSSPGKGAGSSGDQERKESLFERMRRASKESGRKVLRAPPRGLGKKIIVFAHHLSVLDSVERYLIEEEVKHIRVDGRTTAVHRNRLIKQFQEDDVTDVALLSVTACGTGLNLTRANVALFAELYWSPGVVLQAEDRIHRLGQKSETIKIIYLLAKGTADDIVFGQIQRKHDVLGATVGLSRQQYNSRERETVPAEVPIGLKKTGVVGKQKQLSLDYFSTAAPSDKPAGSYQQLPPATSSGMSIAGKPPEAKSITSFFTKKPTGVNTQAVNPYSEGFCSAVDPAQSSVPKSSAGPLFPYPLPPCVQNLNTTSCRVEQNNTGQAYPYGQPYDNETIQFPKSRELTAPEINLSGETSNDFTYELSAQSTSDSDRSAAKNPSVGFTASSVIVPTSAVNTSSLRTYEITQTLLNKQQTAQTSVPRISTSGVASKPSLSPATKARIERNRMEALRKREQRASELSNSSRLSNPSVAPPQVGFLGQGLPPGALFPPHAAQDNTCKAATCYSFSTGSGSSVRVDQEALARGEAFLG